ncbi:MAG: 3',5'-cyclic-nucleotide phosphodiesterase [uncultured Rubrobacteraceae bacterium]|uniref:3',5'-cyclic-nucleotide phosphodiesterase n=1 Tax=uncultured Rubrobacteraceae bacterium TaxID=349277 RepID=A0A6J4QE86_9ACTN|nr:MAG: 3',5'-cyclic-nucleotide phosphodiesterase [uncultured Rubrobacteraceae bacterium]
MTRILHTSDLHFGRPAVAEQLDSLKGSIKELAPDAVAVSGDLTQRCSVSEFLQARAYLDEIRETAPVIVIPGNHDVRWIGAVARNLGIWGRTAHEFKYSRYTKYISPELNPSLEASGDPGAVIAGCNTAHGISRGSLTRRFRDLGVIGHVNKRDLLKVEEAFSQAPPDAARIVMIHHNPIRGETTGRHGLSNTRQALTAFVDLGAELVLCGHDHQVAIHTIEESTPGLVVSTAGTISNRLRAGRPSSFNLVEIDDRELRIITHAWQNPTGFAPSQQRSFPRHAASRSA